MPFLPTSSVSRVADAVLAECSMLFRSRAFTYHHRRICEGFGEREIGSLTRAEVQRWALRRLAERRKGNAGPLRPGTVAAELSFLSRCFKFLRRHGHEIANPAVGIDLPNARQRRPRFLTPDEEQRMRTALLRMGDGEAYASLLDFAVNTGTRLNEMLSLKVGDLDEDVLHITITKTDRPRDIPLNRAALAVARCWAAGRGEGEWLFLPAWGDNRYRVAEHFYRLVYRPAAIAAGLIGFRWRDLRHTAASRMVQRGESLFVVQRFLGHEDPKMTMVYAHLRMDELRAAVGKLV